MATEPTIEEVAAAKERLAHPTRISGDGWHEYLAYDEDDVRTLLASHASLEERRKDWLVLAQQAWGALNFILAFYEPGQNYLDTNAWKQAEARGRRAHAALAAFVNEKET